MSLVVPKFGGIKLLDRGDNLMAFLTSNRSQKVGPGQLELNGRIILEDNSNIRELTDRYSSGELTGLALEARFREVLKSAWALLVASEPKEGLDFEDLAEKGEYLPSPQPGVAPRLYLEV